MQSSTSKCDIVEKAVIILTAYDNAGQKHFVALYDCEKKKSCRKRENDKIFLASQ